MKNIKNFLWLFFPSLLAVIVWELLAWVFKSIKSYIFMLPKEILNPYFILFFLSVNALGFFLLYRQQRQDSQSNNDVQDVDKQQIDVEAIKNLFGHIAHLYNETGLLVKNCFGDETRSRERSTRVSSLLVAFNAFLNDNILNLPKDVFVRSEEFFRMIENHKHEAYILIHANKMNEEYYKQSIALITRFQDEVSPFYQELEKDCRQIIDDQ